MIDAPVWARRVFLSKEEVMERFGEDTPSPTPEEIEAAARALALFASEGHPDAWTWVDQHWSMFTFKAKCVLEAALAVRKLAVRREK